MHFTDEQVFMTEPGKCQLQHEQQYREKILMLGAGEASSILAQIRQTDMANVNMCCIMTNENDKKINAGEGWCPHFAQFITMTNKGTIPLGEQHVYSGHACA